MKKIVPALVTVSILLLGFQNCSQQSDKLGADSGSSNLPSAKIEDPLLSAAQSLDIITRGEDRIVLDLHSGEIVQQNSSGAVKKCLSESMRGQILDLLNNSSLCEFKEPTADQACALVYSAPYAKINWSDKSVQVGEARSSCQKEVDLCGNDGKLLRGFLNDIITRWDEWSCDFKVVSK